MSESVYLGYDNDIRLILKQNSVASDLASVTKIQIVLGTKTITSTNQVADPIRWAQAGYATGEVRMELGGQAITPGTYKHVPVIVMDAVNTSGIFWDDIEITVYGRKGGGPFIP